MHKMCGNLGKQLPKQNYVVQSEYLTNEHAVGAVCRKNVGRKGENIMENTDTS